MAGAAPITRLAAEFVVANRHAALPQEAVDVARLGVTDAVAALLAGLREPAVAVVDRAVQAQQARPEAPVLLGAHRTTADLAALVNATAAHALDVDDYAFACHPSAVLVPVLLACGAATAAQGPDLVAAYVAGYEVWSDLMNREPDHLHSRGWHPTPLFGCIGAAAAAASLLGLDADAAQHAIGLSASHAAGTMGNFGSMAKPYHAGKAAQAGVFCARLAAAGMTATPDVLEGERGLLRTVSPAGRVDVTSPPRYGSYERIRGLRLNIKKYPTVGASQRVIDSVLAHVRQSPVDVASLDRVEPRVSEKHAAVMPYHHATRPEEARFSLEYAVACALVHGRVGLRELAPEAIDDPAVQELMQRVRVLTTAEYDPDYPVAAPFDFVTLTFGDGRRVTTPPVRRATGHADAPLPAAQLHAKFVDCAAYGGVAATKAEELFALLQTFECWTAADLGRLALSDPDGRPA
jgi:2-methylcitrate dehydratase PrpD